MRTLLALLLFAAQAALAPSGSAQAQSWPAKPVRMVVAFAPGGSTDIAVRKRYTQKGLEPVGGSLEQFSRQYRDDYEKYARLIKELNIKLD